jgi:site-specific DNA-methyltransferase (adenine-specific)
MMSESETPVARNVIHTGDCVDVLADLPESSAHMCMTSPPYWQLRDYSHDDQMGLEETPDEYVENIADVMDEVKRVLRDDGSLWLNLGDTYDDKDLQQIPARVAIELQNRGWILRNRVTWAKPNPMPQSVKDRLNDTTEAVFHFAPNREYWYDLDAIRESYAESYKKRAEAGYQHSHGSRRHEYGGPDARHTQGGILDESGEYGDHMHPAGKNPGDVFEVTTKPFPDAHFAVYPPELCEKPIKATCPPDGIVLDPFAGAGTTLLKAKELGRDFIGVELNPKYADMARARVGLEPDDPARVRDCETQQGIGDYV